MTDQIIKVEADPKDEGCVQITLRHIPSKLQFWRSKQPQTIVYKGHGNSWYKLPNFKPAPSRLVPLLKAITYAPQYKHLRYKI